jgi:ribosomal protein S17E
MTPKEKAKELVNKYLKIQYGDFPSVDARKCALITVDEIIDYLISNRITGTLTIYWKEVKKEIIKL